MQPLGSHREVLRTQVPAGQEGVVHGLIWAVVQNVPIGIKPHEQESERVCVYDRRPADRQNDG